MGHPASPDWPMRCHLSKLREEKNGGKMDCVPCEPAERRKSDWPCHSVSAVCLQDQLNKHFLATVPSVSSGSGVLFWMYACRGEAHMSARRWNWTSGLIAARERLVTLNRVLRGWSRDSKVQKGANRCCDIQAGLRKVLAAGSYQTKQDLVVSGLQLANDLLHLCWDICEAFPAHASWFFVSHRPKIKGISSY